MSSWVRPKFSSCIGVSWARCGKALSRRSQHSSSRLGTTSQILNKEPVRLFSWMFTTPPWIYMQPAWKIKKKTFRTILDSYLYKRNSSKIVNGINSRINVNVQRWPKKTELTGVTAAQWKYAGSGITAGSLFHWNICRLIFHRSSSITSPL